MQAGPHNVYLCTDSISDEHKKWKITSQVQPHSNSQALDGVLWQVDGSSEYVLAGFKKPRNKITVDLQMTISSAYVRWRLCGYNEFQQGDTDDDDNKSGDEE